MRLPPDLQASLARSHELASIVHGAMHTFEPLLRDQSPPFFPEYPDHGISHNEEVLATAFSLISSDSRTVVSDNDLAVLVLSVLLHDCAMHLTPDGFVSLVQHDEHWPGLTQLNDRPWSELWDDFLAETRRFDSRRLMALFGTAHPIRNSPMRPDMMTERDRMLIGEFLRRNHPRLAHDIALHGFPGPSGSSNPVLDGVNPTWVDLAGLIARSHGFPIRGCIQYLSERHHKREFQEIHAVFLMVLLRISDYLQIQPQRAPKELLKTKAFRSPISQNEWRVHHAVYNIHLVDDDPEAVSIDASPTDIRAFLRIKAWLGGIQAELDSSWSVLGEVYGRFERLQKLGIRLRRVRSNLDRESEFAQTVDYVPAELRFETSDAELLALLVQPLYGGRMELGLREMLQNSIDAVRELAFLHARQPDAYCYPSDDASDVIVEVEESNNSMQITIRDRGIGMSLDVLQHYFLKAGASFRKADVWKRDFEDYQHRSQVIRSGRFGIGALAAFLIGEKLYVRTRHARERTGYGMEFEASLDDDCIVVKKIRCSPGTEIRITASNEFRSYVRHLEPRFPPTFYRLPWPKVEVRGVSRGARSIQPPDVMLPGECERFKSPWRYVTHNDFPVIHWTYDQAPTLSVNGIEVPTRRTQLIPNWRDPRSLHTYAGPNVSVFDPDGLLPLNLQRTDIAVRQPPFGSRVVDSVVEDAIAFHLVHAPQEPICVTPAAYMARYPGIVSTALINDEQGRTIFGMHSVTYTGGPLLKVFSPAWLSLTAGVMPLDSLAADLCPDDRFLLVVRRINVNTPRDPSNHSEWAKLLADLQERFRGTPIIQCEYDTSGVHGNEEERSLAGLQARMAYFLMYGHWPESLLTNAELVSYRRAYEFLGGRVKTVSFMADVHGRYSQFLREHLHVIPGYLKGAGRGWISFTGKDAVNLEEMIGRGKCFERLKRRCTFVALVCRERTSSEPMGRFAQRWAEICGDFTIPYEHMRRHQSYANAYRELQAFVELHEAEGRSRLLGRWATQI